MCQLGCRVYYNCILRFLQVYINLSHIMLKSPFFFLLVTTLSLLGSLENAGAFPSCICLKAQVHSWMLIYFLYTLVYSYILNWEPSTSQATDWDTMAPLKFPVLHKLFGSDKLKVGPKKTDKKATFIIHSLFTKYLHKLSGLADTWGLELFDS